MRSGRPRDLRPTMQRTSRCCRGRGRTGAPWGRATVDTRRASRGSESVPSRLLFFWVCSQLLETGVRAENQAGQPELALGLCTVPAVGLAGNGQILLWVASRGNRFLCTEWQLDLVESGKRAFSGHGNQHCQFHEILPLAKACLPCHLAHECIPCLGGMSLFPGLPEPQRAVGDLWHRHWLQDFPPRFHPPEPGAGPATAEQGLLCPTDCLGQWAPDHR